MDVPVQEGTPCQGGVSPLPSLHPTNYQLLRKRPTVLGT